MGSVTRNGPFNDLELTEAVSSCAGWVRSKRNTKGRKARGTTDGRKGIHLFCAGEPRHGSSDGGLGPGPGAWLVAFSHARWIPGFICVVNSSDKYGVPIETIKTLGYITYVV